MFGQSLKSFFNKVGSNVSLKMIDTASEDLIQKLLDWKPNLNFWNATLEDKITSGLLELIPLVDNFILRRLN